MDSKFTGTTSSDKPFFHKKSVFESSKVNFLEVPWIILVNLWRLLAASPHNLELATRRFAGRGRRAPTGRQLGEHKI